MSLQLLAKLNGNKNGILLKLLKSYNNNKEPQIAWYPSAGEDFHDVLFLSEAFYHMSTIENTGLNAPDFFIHTDYFPWRNSTLFDNRILYEDSITQIVIKDFEELPSLNLSLDAQIVEFPNGGKANNKVIFSILNVSTSKSGTWDIPLLYIFAENATFFNQVVLPNNSTFSHIVNIRFGGSGGGGGHSSGIWIKNVLKRIGCKLLITDNHYFEGHGDKRIYELYPHLEQKDKYNLKTIKTIPQSQWDGYGDVHWEFVSY